MKTLYSYQNICVRSFIFHMKIILKHKNIAFVSSEIFSCQDWRPKWKLCDNAELSYSEMSFQNTHITFETLDIFAVI